MLSTEMDIVRTDEQSATSPVPLEQVTACSAFEDITEITDCLMRLSQTLRDQRFERQIAHDSLIEDDDVNNPYLSEVLHLFPQAPLYVKNRLRISLSRRNLSLKKMLMSALRSGSMNEDEVLSKVYEEMERWKGAVSRDAGRDDDSEPDAATASVASVDTASEWVG